MNGRLSRVSQLRRKVWRHNRGVLALSAGSLLLAAVLWGALFVVSSWATLFVLTVVAGGEARISPSFPWFFLAAVALLFGAALLGRRLNPYPHPPDRKTKLQVALDFLLMPPRVTFAVWDYLAAWLRLSPPDLAAAIHLLDRVREIRRLPLYSLPVEIPEPTQRERVLLALQHLQLLETVYTTEAAFLRVVVARERPAGPRRLA